MASPPRLTSRVGCDTQKLYKIMSSCGRQAPMPGVVRILLSGLLTLDGAIARGGHCLLATDGRGYEGPDAGSEAEPSPGLSAFGYRQSLHRFLRSLSLYALTFSSLGVLLSSVLLIGPYWAAARGGAIWAYAAGALICQTLI